ncbi:MAG: glycosyltransferase [Cytophagales bacterium]|nr:glycosyltransferase [Cytophagales bacterium]
MKPLTISYYVHPYQSLHRAALVNQQLLRNHCDRLLIVSNPEDADRLAAQADVVILHVPLDQLERIYAAYPVLNHKYVIGYIVFEASEITAPWAKALSRVQEVWTASRYCTEVLQKYHRQVIRIPHVIERDVACSEADRAFIRRLIGHQPQNVYFLSISAVGDTRKNTNELVECFLGVSDAMPGARLVIKSTRPNDPDAVADHPQVIYLKGVYTASQLNALYELTDVYVSPHHAEGWGYTLSDAMLFGKPVIGTRYSGNLDYMNDENSFLIDAEEDFVRPEDQNAVFGPSMKWAYPSRSGLREKLTLLYRNVNEEWVARKTEQAREDIRQFSGRAVRQLIQQRLDQLRALLPKRPAPGGGITARGAAGPAWGTDGAHGWPANALK